MSSLLVLLFLLALLGLVTGIFKPLSVPLMGRKSRGRIFKFYGAAAVILFVLVGLTAPKPEQSSSPQPLSSNLPTAPVTQPIAIQSAPLSPESSLTSNHPLSQFKFPQQTCGDLAVGENDTWYPVFADADRFTDIQQNYCADAIKTVRQQSGKPAVQVASFVNQEKAIAFAQAVKGDVGKPTDLKTTSTPTRLSERKIAPQAIAPASPATLAIGSPIREAVQGSCDCPYDIDRKGRSCGSRSAYSRPGGSSPACYVGDRSERPGLGSGNEHFEHRF